MQPDCIFCKIAAGEIDSEFVYEDDLCVAFRDLSPQAPVHVLLIPRRHIENVGAMTQADAELAGHLVVTAPAIATKLGLAEGRDYLVFYDSTMARFWFENSRAEQAVRGALGELDCGAFLTDDDLKREGVYFDDHRFGELVFLMHPRELIVPSYMGGRAPRGMHGFSPDHEDSYAVLMSSFDVSPAPEHIRDSFEVMKKAARLIP